MPQNIESIVLEQGLRKDNPMRTVKINFKFSCSWTKLDVEDLLKILELWIIGEEEVYPQSERCKGRWMLFEKIKEVFDNTPKPNEVNGGDLREQS